MILRLTRPLAIASLAAIGLSSPVQAQDAQPPHRYRVTLGPQVGPRYPGADGANITPFFDLARARGDEQFVFSAADESFGLSLFQANGFAAGAVLGFEGSRRKRDAPGLPRVGFTFEPGGFVQYNFGEPLRARVEVRQGIGGHKGLTSYAGVDYVARDRDEWLFAIGPRLTVSNGRYQRAYFGVPADRSIASGLPTYRPSGGIQAVGGTASFIKRLTPRWGVYTYGKYDRLVDDAGRSPVVRAYGSRNQWSAGLAASYTFGGGN